MRVAIYAGLFVKDV